MPQILGIKHINRPRFRPLLNPVPIDTFMLNIEIWPRPREIGEPAVGHQGDVGFAHDDLAEHVDAVIYMIRRLSIWGEGVHVVEEGKKGERGGG